MFLLTKYEYESNGLLKKTKHRLYQSKDNARGHVIRKVSQFPKGLIKEDGDRVSTVFEMHPDQEQLVYTIEELELED